MNKERDLNIICEQLTRILSNPDDFAASSIRARDIGMMLIDVPCARYGVHFSRHFVTFIVLSFFFVSLLFFFFFFLFYQASYLSSEEVANDLVLENANLEPRLLTIRCHVSVNDN